MYEIRIIRPGGTITLDEWKAAVDYVDGVRLRSNDIPATNPHTGEVITVPHREGDAEIFFEDTRQSGPILTWRSRGYVVFRGTDDFVHDESRVRLVIRALADRLNASVLGEGEKSTNLRSTCTAKVEGTRFRPPAVDEPPYGGPGLKPLVRLREPHRNA